MITPRVMCLMLRITDGTLGDRSGVRIVEKQGLPVVGEQLRSNRDLKQVVKQQNWESQDSRQG